MRTKKTNIKEGKISRTIKFTAVDFLSGNLETKEVKDDTYILPLEYTAKEAEDALRELGILVVTVTGVSYFERQYSMNVSDFIRYGDKGEIIG